MWTWSSVTVLPSLEKMRKMSKQQFSNHLNSTQPSILIRLRASSRVQLDQPGVVICCECLSCKDSSLGSSELRSETWERNNSGAHFDCNKSSVCPEKVRREAGRRFDRIQCVFFIWGSQSIQRVPVRSCLFHLFVPEGVWGYEAIIHSSPQHYSLIEVDILDIPRK